ncbi:hypothetical protein [Absiella sp. AM29-15]|uniref:hypothetical protein n=1 Tax=Absiella sp. AM29-15 TaxID=2292278 RepID=UPI000E40B699|nr:hypothetical protein [Absiella sp. AM29-15]RGC51820.1 hypothetical protein DW761_09085 [Absiella sp. AM29-15]
MKEEIIQTLPSSLIRHMKSLKTLSYDDIHKCYLTDSVVTAIDLQLYNQANKEKKAICIK